MRLADEQNLPGNEYTDLIEIGRGASSTVYRARSTLFARDVSLKIFHGTMDDPQLRSRFHHECRVVGSLGDHPHVVSVFDSGFTVDRRPFLVMAHCGGGSFRQRVIEHGVRPVEEVVAVGVAVADALAAAHSRGVVHRDVKPHNVLLTGYGVVALADFGVAAHGADPTPLAGTLGYAAPEVLGAAGDPGPAADIYALGATLFALLAGTPPFRLGAEESELAFVQRTSSAPPPALPDRVPAAVGEVIDSCLADRRRRTLHALDVQQGLTVAAEEAGLALPRRLPVLAMGQPPVLGNGPALSRSSPTGLAWVPDDGAPTQPDLGRPRGGGSLDDSGDAAVA